MFAEALGMNWDDPAARAKLIDLVGISEYNARHAVHRATQVVATVNGYEIRTVSTSFGVLFSIDGTGKAFGNQPDAEDYARRLDPGSGS